MFLVLVILLIGMIAVGGQIDRAESSVNDSDPGSDALNASVDAVDKFTRVQGAAIPIVGLSAVAMLALGLLAATARGGR